MIVVTRLDRAKTTYAINPDLIERMDENPDTTLHMADGATHLVAETMAQVIELIARYRAYVLTLARDLSTPSGVSPSLSVVRPVDPSADQPAAAGRRPSRQ